MASAHTTFSQPPENDDLINDERWQLVQRIISSPPFQKGTRLRDLLQYVTEQTIRGRAHDLTEQHIGNALFHKPSNYSPLEDSSVRVHARQLRLKLHEYFNEDGREESLILEIPKGAYSPVFRAVPKPVAAPVLVASAPELAAATTPAAKWRPPAALPWILSGALAVACLALLVYRGSANSPASASAAFASAVAAAPPAALPWPFSQIFDNRHQTLIVVADSNYGMSRILASQSGSLDQYLRREFQQGPSVNKFGAADARLTDYISSSTLTSYADVADVVSLMKMAGPMQSHVSVRYPRDLRMRDLDHENYIFIGSPASNPWVGLFQDRLNFRESETVVGKSAKVFMNKNPLPGEQAQYEGLRWTGSQGEDYATISVLPNATHDGSVLALQGLQQEGTEAAGRFLADEENRRQLMHALGISPSDAGTQNIWFEALIRSRTVSGAPNSTTLVAVRRIQ
jgi:hypothetical protein